MGSTHSLRSIWRMRCSAVIGSENTARSTRVVRANSTRSSTLPSLGETLQIRGRTRVVAVVEHADQLDLGRVSLAEIADEFTREIAAADHDHALLKPPGSGEPLDDGAKAEARDGERVEAQQIPRNQPEARDDVFEPREEHQRDQRRERHRPGAAHAHELADGPA